MFISKKIFFKKLKKKNENGHIGNFKCFLRWPLASFFFLLPFGASVAFYLLHRWDFCSKSGGGNSCVVGPTDTPSVKHGSMDPFNGTPSRRWRCPGIVKASWLRPQYRVGPASASWPIGALRWGWRMCGRCSGLRCGLRAVRRGFRGRSRHGGILQDHGGSWRILKDPRLCLSCWK